MNQLLTANEVFRIGIEIEKNGLTFYRASAEKSAGAPIKKLLNELADWENQHIEIFEELRKSLPPQLRNENLFDPEDEIGLYVKAMADNHIFVKNSDSEAFASRCTTAEEILNCALTFEKDSVVFYAAMREVVGEAAGKSEVDEIIHEELTHIGILTRELQKVKGK
jgi:rubrerythrin